MRAVSAGIGELREGPLHAAIKDWLARPGDRLEVRVGRFVIDLVRADGELVEIQTGGFGPLGPKLDALLDVHRMRIVHPVPAERRILRVDDAGHYSRGCGPQCPRRLEGRMGALDHALVDSAARQKHRVGYAPGGRGAVSNHGHTCVKGRYAFD